VRVHNLQELVYKQGQVILNAASWLWLILSLSQARVTKASVSIVFDNRDRKRSPVGYEQFDEITVTRQIVIGGRNK
jgi:structural maintenance of chromosome 2